jgi:hypothetical protein
MPCVLAGHVYQRQDVSTLLRIDSKRDKKIVDPYFQNHATYSKGPPGEIRPIKEFYSAEQ